jgi:hypothetical protein
MVSKCRHLRPFRSPDFWVENFEMLIGKDFMEKTSYVRSKLKRPLFVAHDMSGFKS